VNLRSLSSIQIALGISLAVHAALLTLRIVDPESFNRVFQDTPLEVILVNAKTSEAPLRAQAIAQANLAGGGDAETGRATSPLPPAILNMTGESSAQDDERQLRSLQAQQAMILAEVKKTLSTMPPQPPHPTNSPEQQERELKRRELIKLLAEIERRINTENARPRKRYVSPATREAAYAVYYDRLRRAIEEKGTENFPQQGGQKLYGELTMIVTINFDGRVLATEIVQSSGQAVLDRRAQAIARSAGPYGTFSAEMRRQADQIAVVSRFKFTRDDTLQTQLTGN